MWSLIQNINILVVGYVTAAATIFVYGCFLNIFSQRLDVPAFITDFLHYGKLNHKKKLSSIVSWLQVPKRWFVHFYIFAVIEAFCSVMLFWTINIFEMELPIWLRHVFDVLTLPNRVTTIPSSTAYVALCLYAAHVTKRLLENVYLSIFSSSSMNVLHYFMGLCHYPATFTLLLALFPGISAVDSMDKMPSIHENILQIIGVTIVLSSMYLQYDSLKRLAALRLNKDSYDKHFMPIGGLFNIISCPHMFCEIVIYVGIAGVMGFRHKYFNVVCLFVVFNQIQIAMMNHHWYKTKFKEYPRRRKAIFPYLL